LLPGPDGAAISFEVDGVWVARLNGVVRTAKRHVYGSEPGEPRRWQPPIGLWWAPGSASLAWSYWPASVTSRVSCNDRKACSVTKDSANKMWGGRFTMSPAEIMQEINASIGFDKALAPQDIRASKAHAAMLAAQGIISKDDAKKINAGLDKVLAEIEGGTSSSPARWKTCT
jgi:hypothetical protein